jgi:Ca2+-transporting ATPase
MSGLAIRKEDMELGRPWAQSKETVLEAFDVSSENGLTSDEARRRLESHGPNLLQIEKKASWVRRLAGQFKSPVVIVLLVATVVSALLGETTDAIAIATIIFINAVIGFMQEAKAEAAVEALKQLAAPRSRVVRDGAIVEIAGSEVCPGDVLVLESGDYIAADARIIVANQLAADEAVLTGESLPAEKALDPVAQDALLGDRRDMLFAGTSVSSGTARAVVTATGMATEIGKIAGMLGAAETPQTPLQIRLEQVSRKLLVFCGVVVVLVALLGIFHGEKWIDVLMTAISLAVAAIPEGLPTVVTLALALAVRRMVKRNAIIRHLPAVETLGSTDVICTDKTGTLTTGKMRVREVVLPDGVVHDVSGPLRENTAFRRLVGSSVLCSNASLSQSGNGSAQSTGDPTEVALLYLADDQKIDRKEIAQLFPRLSEWSFDSVRKRMSVAVREESGVTIHVKGAPETVLERCDLPATEKRVIQERITELSGLGRRLLAVGERKLPGQAGEFDSKRLSNPTEVERDLTFLGLVAIADPPRPESIKAISDCKAAGIKVVMITGDHPITAKAIAKELGIVEPGRFEEVLSGTDLQKMSASELKDRVKNVAVYARVSPEDKLKIVRAWKENGSIVAMTGDGVNDAPALKEASIGVSMGKGGTEVARQASSMILADDHFATIVSAIEEGRAIYGNIRRTIAYLLSGNLAEILIMLGAAVAGWPTPLAPIHLLWINLVTDGLPSLALAA